MTSNHEEKPVFSLSPLTKKQAKRAAELIKRQKERGSQDEAGIVESVYFYLLGEDAFSREDYKKAEEWFRMSAERNNAEAQYYLGFLYEKGSGVEQSLPEAKKWYAKAADQGHQEAKSRMQLMEFENNSASMDIVDEQPDSASHVDLVNAYKSPQNRNNGTGKVIVGAIVGIIIGLVACYCIFVLPKSNRSSITPSSSMSTPQAQAQAEAESRAQAEAEDRKSVCRERG